MLGSFRFCQFMEEGEILEQVVQFVGRVTASLRLESGDYSEEISDSKL